MKARLKAGNKLANMAGYSFLEQDEEGCDKVVDRHGLLISKLINVHGTHFPHSAWKMPSLCCYRTQHSQETHTG